VPRASAQSTPIANSEATSDRASWLRAARLEALR
jgi:hypothetical protein